MKNNKETKFLKSADKIALSLDEVAEAFLTVVRHTAEEFDDPSLASEHIQQVIKEVINKITIDDKYEIRYVRFIIGNAVGILMSHLREWFELTDITSNIKDETLNIRNEFQKLKEETLNNIFEGWVDNSDKEVDEIK